MSHTPPVFISYPQDGAAGQALANELFQRLQAEGIAAFLDTECIRLGERWIQALGNGVKQCRVVLSVVSPASHDRPWVEKEYIAANNLRLPLIPVLATAGDVPFQMNDVQVARLYGEYKDKDWQRLLTRIREYLPDTSAEKFHATETAYLEARVDAYLDWVQNTFLHDMNAYTEMDGIQRLRAEPEVCRITFIGEADDEFADLDELCGGLPERQVREEKTFDNILDALAGLRQGIFLGKPGAGKSTTLWKLAHDEIQQNRAREQRIVPVILRLGFWVQDAQPLLEFIHAQTNIDVPKLGDAFAELLAQQRILLILDGLNEMPVSQQQDKGRQIRDFLAAHPALWAYASCREDDYSDGLRLPVPEFHIQPLSIPKIKTFIHSYLQAKGIQQAEEAANKLFWDIAGGQELLAVWQVWEQAGATPEQFWLGLDFPKGIYRRGKNAGLWKRKIRDNPQNLICLARNPYM